VRRRVHLSQEEVRKKFFYFVLIIRVVCIKLLSNCVRVWISYSPTISETRRALDSAHRAGATPVFFSAAQLDQSAAGRVSRCTRSRTLRSDVRDRVQMLGR